MKGQLRLAFFDLSRTPPSSTSLLSPALCNLITLLFIGLRYEDLYTTSAQYISKNTPKQHASTRTQTMVYIRRKQLGVKFRRQHSIERYIIDFFCCELKLAIELDGNSHFSEQAQAYDHQRTQDLDKLGIRVLRFTNNEVNHNIEEVLARIMDSIPKYTSI